MIRNVRQNHICLDVFYISEIFLNNFRKHPSKRAFPFGRKNEGKILPSLSASWNGKEVKMNGTLSFPGWTRGHAPVWPSVPVSIGWRSGELLPAYGVPKEPRSKFLWNDRQGTGQHFCDRWIQSKHYEGYIAKLSTRKMYDEFGQTHYCVDETLRRRLETKLIAKTLAFRPVPYKGIRA